MAGIVLYMFVDVPYPLSVKLMERMLKHKLELARDVVGNDLTTAEQLIGLIKNQLAAAQECGASESNGVYVSSLHSQHHAHMCFCCFLILVKCFAAVPISIPSGRTFIVPAGRYVVPAGVADVRNGIKCMQYVGERREIDMVAV
ncbi:hypothetical protein Tco_0571111 [Tanacetum coccineum]